MCSWHHCHPCVVVFGALLQLSVHVSVPSLAGAFFLSCVSVSMCGSTTRATLCVPLARARPHVLPPTRKSCVICPAGVSSFLRHGGHAHRRVYCLLLLERVAVEFCPLSHKHVFQGLAGWYLVYMLTSPVTLFLFPGALKSWCGTIVTMFSKDLKRDSQDLCCFSSWMHLLGGEDNCMLSVPFCTSDPHISYWQGGDICKVVATEAFTLYGCNFFWCRFKRWLLSLFSVLMSCQRVVCSMFPVF